MQLKMKCKSKNALIWCEEKSDGYIYELEFCLHQRLKQIRALTALRWWRPSFRLSRTRTRSSKTCTHTSGRTRTRLQALVSRTRLLTFPSSSFLPTVRSWSVSRRLLTCFLELKKRWRTSRTLTPQWCKCRPRDRENSGTCWRLPA